MSTDSLRAKLREIAEDIKRVVGEVEKVLRTGGSPIGVPQVEASHVVVGPLTSERSPNKHLHGYRVLREDEYQLLVNLALESRRWSERLKVLEEEIESLKSSLTLSTRGEDLTGSLIEKASLYILDELNVVGEARRERLVDRASRSLRVSRPVVYKAIDDLVAKGVIKEDRGWLRLAKGIGRMDVKLEEYFMRRFKESLGRIPLGSDLEELWILVEGGLRDGVSNLFRDEALAKAFEEVEKLLQRMKTRHE